MITHH